MNPFTRSWQVPPWEQLFGEQSSMFVEHVGPVQPGEHSHSKPEEVSLQLPLLWQGSERQACSAISQFGPE